MWLDIPHQSKLNKMKWEDKHENNYSLRSRTTNDVKIPVKPMKKCTVYLQWWQTVQ